MHSRYQTFFWCRELLFSLQMLIQKVLGLHYCNKLLVVLKKTADLVTRQNFTASHAAGFRGDRVLPLCETRSPLKPPTWEAKKLQANIIIRIPTDWVFTFFIFAGFDFGVRQNGQRVMDVEVPQWAKGSTRLFMLIHRQVSNKKREPACK